MKSIRSLVIAAIGVSLFAGQAFAHIKMLEPKPRDDRDDHKNDNAPCIARTMAQTVTKLNAGGMVTVKFGETVNHPGCFVVDFAASDTGPWQMLDTLPHSTMGGASDAKPRMYSKDVKLPSTPCTNCVLRVRQLMLRADPATCPPATIPAGETYYSCANIELASGGTPDAGGGEDAASAGTGGSSGTGGASAGTGGSGSGAGGASAGTGGSASTGGSSGTGGSSSGAGGSDSSSGGTSGSGVARNTGGSSGSNTGGSASSSSGDSGGSSGGCAVAAGAPSAAPGALLLTALGFIGMLARRRRR
jgi:MYXO-CTERM domain-containing protein